jgi:hypothetical protein
MSSDLATTFNICFRRKAWREYAAYQSKIGNPCLYYVTEIETTRERFTEQDYELLRQTWTRYNAELDEKYRETSNVSKKNRKTIRVWKCFQKIVLRKI